MAHHSPPHDGLDGREASPGGVGNGQPVLGAGLPREVVDGTPWSRSASPGRSPRAARSRSGAPALLWSALVGLLVASAAGVVALHGEALGPGSRSTGFGLFYTLDYVCMGLAPAAAGYLVDRSGGATAAWWLVAVLWLLALPALGVFRVLQRRGRGDGSV